MVVSRSYPPVVGGSEIETARVCAALIRNGHHVEVVCCGGEPMPPVRRWIDPGGVPVKLYGNGSGRLADYAFALGVVRTLWRSRRQVQLVYFVMPGIHVAVGVPIARALGLPVVMKFSGSNTVRSLTESLVGRLELRFLRRWADQILLLNSGMLEEAVRCGLDRRRISWMPNPVDMNEFVPCSRAERGQVRAELGLPEMSHTAIYVGRLAPEKELATLLRAFHQVVREAPRARLVLVGDGPERTRLQEMATALDLGDKVRFTGMLDTKQVLRWLRASDVFVLVSSLEGLPLSLIEAMAVGLPSVVSDIPATRQLVSHEKTGLVTPLGEEAAVAAALLRLFNDAVLGERFGSAARQEVAAKFSTEHVAQSYETLFSRLASRQRVTR